MVANAKPQEEEKPKEEIKEIPKDDIKPKDENKENIKPIKKKRII